MGEMRNTMKSEAEQRKCLAVVRVHGRISVLGETSDTMKMLHLTRNCHVTLVDNRASYLGMLQKAQSYIAWGEVSKETVAILLKKKGRLVGDKKLTDEYAQKVGKKSLDDLAEAIFKGELEFQKLPDIKPIFRLHPPSRGYKGKIKRSFAAGGVSGYHGEAVNSLLEQMI
jgi:large subunit ribosomal protein L30